MQYHAIEELHKHLIQGDANGVNKLLDSGDIESPDQMIDLFDDGDEETLLMLACNFYFKRNDISLIRDLVKKHNANVNAQKGDGYTAVHIASIIGHVPVLRFLVEEGRANLELRDSVGMSPLHFACGEDDSNEDIVRCLLDNHADINAANEHRMTPLHYAALLGKCSITRLLLADERVNIEAVDKYGRTPLNGACMKGRPEIVEILLNNGANLNDVDSGGRTPLIYAVQFRKTACIGVLIKAEADLNMGDSMGQTALHHAVAWGNKDVLELLLESKADWSAKDNDNRMPVELAKPEHRGGVESLFVDSLIGMVQQHQVFRVLTKETRLLGTLPPDVAAHIADYCDIPKGDELNKIKLELERLRPGRHGQKRKQPGSTDF